MAVASDGEKEEKEKGDTGAAGTKTLDSLKCRTVDGETIFGR